MVESNTPRSKKWWLGLGASFITPFVLFGALATYWAYQRGQEEIDRWSQLVQPKTVPFPELVGQIAVWFIGAGLIAGLAGALLYYLFTRCRSS